MIRTAGFMGRAFVIFVIVQAVGMHAIGLIGFVEEDDLDRIAFDAANDQGQGSPASQAEISLW